MFNGKRELCIYSYQKNKENKKGSKVNVQVYNELNQLLFDYSIEDNTWVKKEFIYSGLLLVERNTFRSKSKIPSEDPETERYKLIEQLNFKNSPNVKMLENDSIVVTFDQSEVTFKINYRK